MKVSLHPLDPRSKLHSSRAQHDLCSADVTGIYVVESAWSFGERTLFDPVESTQSTTGNSSDCLAEIHHRVAAANERDFLKSDTADINAAVARQQSN